MTETPPTNLNTLRSHIADRLADAITNRDAGWRTPTLATIGIDGGPRARTVVLRSVDVLRCRLLIYTDQRSAKMHEIKATDRVALSFWDAHINQQLRLTGRASVVPPGPDVNAAWVALPVASRLPYLVGLPPGHHLTQPDCNQPENRGGRALTPAETDDGRDVFTLLAIVWTAWDWLWVGRSEHRRAQWNWEPADNPQAVGDCQGNWVVP